MSRNNNCCGITTEDPHGNDLFVNPHQNLLVSLENFAFKTPFKMVKNLFLVLSEVVAAFSVLLSASPFATSAKFERQVKFKNEDFKMNDTELIKESQKNNTLTTLDEVWFWTLSDMKNTTEMVAPEMDVHDIQETQNVEPGDKESFETEKYSESNKSAIVEHAVGVAEPTEEEINHADFSNRLNDSIQINEKIIMPRNNCYAEIAVHENRDTKLTIKFGRLENNSYGRCCLTLSGRENSMLGVIVSNVHLYRNNTQGEVLKVIVGNRYSAFVLKEYYGSRVYEPLLLTETHVVYLVLDYKVEYVAPNQDCTYFNLEVFTYEKYESMKDDNNHIDAAQINHAQDVYFRKKPTYFIP